jgi:FtsX-like permease family
MRWRTTIALAVKSVTRRLGRAVLSLAGVALAAALMAAMLATVRMARTQLLDEISRGGPLATIKVTSTSRSFSDVPVSELPTGPVRPLAPGAIDRLAALPGVEGVEPVAVSEELIVPPPALGTPASSGESSSGSDASLPHLFVGTVVGIDLASVRQLPLTVDAGRLPAERSLTEVAVTPAYLQRIGVDPHEPGPVLSSEIELGVPRVFTGITPEPDRPLLTRARVVGVVSEAAMPAEVLGSLDLVREAQRRLAAGGESTARLGLSSASDAALIVVARQLSDVETLVDRIRSLGYVASAPEGAIETVLHYLHVVEIVLVGVAVIAMAIAVLGVADTMLAAVRERRREIGVLSAVGAGPRDVRRLFLVEGSVIGLLGGLVGTGLGWAMAEVLHALIDRYLAQQGLRAVPSGFVPGVAAAALGVSVALSVVAALLPAWRAAGTSPSEAIREIP